MSFRAVAVSANTSVPNEGATTSLRIRPQLGEGGDASLVAASVADALTAWLFAWLRDRDHRASRLHQRPLGSRGRRSARGAGEREHGEDSRRQQRKPRRAL